jgi:hypothetical protein
MSALSSTTCAPLPSSRPGQNIADVEAHHIDWWERDAGPTDLANGLNHEYDYSAVGLVPSGLGLVERRSACRPVNRERPGDVVDESTCPIRVESVN